MNKKKLIFGAAAALLPVIFLLLVELFLLLFDLFPQPPLFIKEGTTFKINSAVGERYFNKNEMAVPNLYPQTFSVSKDKETFRIFCLGGSSTAGFPYDMTVPFPRQLAFILQNEYPAKKFEVINMGLSAINSFTVLDWLPDIMDHEPDLILIYMGHNEFYGAYGTGSTISFGHNATLVRLIIKLQKLRIIQMLNRFVQSFADEPSHDPGTTIMEKIVDERFIAADSRLREVTHDNFSDNLDLILSACVENKTPVIISNLASNLKDQPPLDARASQTTDSTMALYYYNKGTDQITDGDSANAYISFSVARDKDAIPFRANSDVNRIINDKAAQYGVSFVDMDKTFRSISPLGIPGDNLFCDHLHPNPYGYKIMANMFRKAIAKTKLLPGNSTPKKYPSKPHLVTSLDWEIGAIRIFVLKHRWPFANKQLDFTLYQPYENEMTAQIAREFLYKHNVWGRAHSDMAAYYEKQGMLQKASAEYQAIIEMYPQKTNYHSRLLHCARALREWTLVIHTSKKALHYAKSKGEFYYNLALAQRMTGDIKSAIENINKAIAAPELNRDQLASYYYTYATFLVDIRQLTAARQMLQDVIEEVPDFKQAKELLKRLPVQ